MLIAEICSHLEASELLQKDGVCLQQAILHWKPTLTAKYHNPLLFYSKFEE